MMTVDKDEVKKIINSLSEDTAYEEILRELAFGKMIGQGLHDIESGKVISNQEIENIIAKY